MIDYCLVLKGTIMEWLVLDACKWNWGSFTSWNNIFNLYFSLGNKIFKLQFWILHKIIKSTSKVGGFLLFYSFIKSSLMHRTLFMRHLNTRIGTADFCFICPLISYVTVFICACMYWIFNSIKCACICLLLTYVIKIIGTATIFSFCQD